MNASNMPSKKKMHQKIQKPFKYKTIKKKKITVKNRRVLEIHL